MNHREQEPRDGCDDCDDVFGGRYFIVAPSRREKTAPKDWPLLISFV